MRSRAGDLGREGALALESVEVLGEGPTAREEVVALDKDGGEGVELVERVEQAKEVAWVAVRGEGEEVAQGGREKGCELLFGEELEEGGLLRVESGA